MAGFNEFEEGFTDSILLEGVEVEACPELSDHIRKQISRSLITNYLTEKDIEPLYQYDRTYLSYASSARDKRDEIISSISDPEVLAKVKAELDAFVADKEKEDNEACEAVKAAYDTFIKETNTKVQKMYDEACRRQENEYQSYVTSFEETTDINELEKLIRSFGRMTDYMDAKKYITKCEDKIISIRQREAAKEAEMSNKKGRGNAAGKAVKFVLFVVLAAVVIAAVVIACTM